MNKKERTQKWSIRKLSVGVASVVVASGYFVTATPVAADTVAAAEMAQTDSTATDKPQATSTEKSEEKQMMATDETVKQSVENLKDTVEVPADYLEEAHYPGPFTAGVNQVIPYEAFGGDGMLTRLILKQSDTAKWSDNGVDHNPALAPAENLAEKQYFYEVDLNGNTTGKENQALLNQLKANGTHQYDATVKVYASNNQMPDTSKVVATKNVSIHVHAVASNKQVADSVANEIKDSIDVPAEYLENATQAAPFTAGVNQVIPYEAFGGDGMLTRLLLKQSDTAKWSDNGVDHNPALLATDDLGHQRYFYEVDLNGNTTGISGDDLLALLKKNGTQDYAATVKVYAAKDSANGRVANLDQVIAVKQVMVHLNGKTSVETVQRDSKDSFNETTQVPLAYVNAAVAPGPFTAGVNQVIPYEAFGGDGMLTRLLLKAANGAAWSDNGKAMNRAILPIENLGHGQYFYEVDLDGVAQGKTGQDLIDALKAAGMNHYRATIKVYGSKNHKADLNNLVFEKTVNIAVAGETMSEPAMDMDMDTPMPTPMDMPSDTSTMMTNSEEVSATSMDNHMMADHKMMELPHTGAQSTASTTVLGVLSLVVGTILSGVGFKRRSNSHK